MTLWSPELAVLTFRVGNCAGKRANPFPDILAGQWNEMMRIDIVSQILDGISFILITPEFLRESTLVRFRSANENVTKRVNKFYSTYAFVLVFIMFLLIAVIAVVQVVEGGFFAEPVHNIITTSAALLLVLGLLIQFLSGVVTLFLSALDKIAFRERIFLIGAALFFLSRALMIGFAPSG